MRRRAILQRFGAGMTGSAIGFGTAARAAGLPGEGDAALGVRTALQRGAESAVSVLGRTGGFLDDPKVRIPLPSYMKDIARMARFTGQQGKVDELVVGMNRAAEAAVPEAMALLAQAVHSLSLQDARALLAGGDDAVTRFFATKTRAPLGEKFLPIVTRITERTALAAKVDAVAGQAAATGLLKPDEASIEQYVTGKALDGLYLMIGEEERRIRRDPVGTGSAILSKVFGSFRTPG